MRDIGELSPHVSGTLDGTELFAAQSQKRARSGAEPNVQVSADQLARYASDIVMQVAANGDVYYPARTAMTIVAGNVAAIGSATLAVFKSTAAAPGTFNSTGLPTTLEAGAWLKVTFSAVVGFAAIHLKQQA